MAEAGDKEVEGNWVVNRDGVKADGAKASDKDGGAAGRRNRKSLEILLLLVLLLLLLFLLVLLSTFLKMLLSVVFTSSKSSSSWGAPFSSRSSRLTSNVGRLFKNEVMVVEVDVELTAKVSDLSSKLVETDALKTAESSSSESDVVRSMGLFAVALVRDIE
jgi:hypothetical protein